MLKADISNIETVISKIYTKESFLYKKLNEYLRSEKFS